MVHLSPCKAELSPGAPALLAVQWSSSWRQVPCLAWTAGAEGAWWDALGNQQPSQDPLHELTAAQGPAQEV